MARKYIQVKDNLLGDAYNNRSFLVSSENADSFGIRKDTIFVPKEFALLVEEQRINPGAETVHASLVLNQGAISKVEIIPFKDKPKDHKLKVVDSIIENGILYLYFGEEYDTEEQELWYKARNFVLDRKPLSYDVDFYKKQYKLFTKKQEGLFDQEFVEGITKQYFIMKDTFRNPGNGNVSVGYSLRSGDDFVTSFGEFESVEALKESKYFKLAMENKL